MTNATPFGSRSTADQVLAGVDLSGKYFVVTGCSSGLGLETMNSLAANGAHVIGLARHYDTAKTACAKVSRSCIPIACDLSDLDSISAAADAIRALGVSLDAIVANAGVANLPALQTRYGVEMQFLVNHIGHFALVGALCDLVRDKTGRIVIVTSNASITQAPAEGIRFDNLDGHLFYRPFSFYGQSKFAVALYAKELSRRLNSRGIAVNSVHPGPTSGTRLNRHLQKPLSWLHGIAKLFMRNAQRATRRGDSGAAGRQPPRYGSHRGVLDRLRHRRGESPSGRYRPGSQTMGSFRAACCIAYAAQIASSASRRLS